MVTPWLACFIQSSIEPVKMFLAIAVLGLVTIGIITVVLDYPYHRINTAYYVPKSLLLFHEKECR